MMTAAFFPMQIATTELLGPDGKRSVDHIACGSGLTASAAEMISNLANDGRQISDHFGVLAHLRAVGEHRQV